MALVAHSGLPAFEELRAERTPVITPGEAAHSGLPDLSIGLLNLMPDAALRATDRQFLRLVSGYADVADLWVYVFTVAASHRGPAARQHISRNYSDFATITELGVDALIVTGANPAHHELSDEAFWPGLNETFDWAEANTNSVLCSCLATHAVLERKLGTKRVRLPQKMWGVYSHRLVDDHPLLDGVQTPVAAPHSHWYDITRERFEAAGVRVLAESDEAGVHMAVTEDDFYVFFQGHPEYDLVSLLKEYQREVARFFSGEAHELPPYPAHYFPERVLDRLEGHREATVKAKATGGELPTLEEGPLLEGLANPWTDAGQGIYRNWLNLVETRKYARSLGR